MPTLRRFVLFLLLSSLAIGGVVAIIAFSQNVPLVTVTPLPTLTPNCGTTGGTPLTATPSSVTAGSSGNIFFSCGANSALTAPNGPVTATPTFTDTGYNGFFLVSGSTNCPATGTITSTNTLTTGTSATIAGGSYDYCASYVSASGGSL